MFCSKDKSLSHINAKSLCLALSQSFIDGWLTTSLEKALMCSLHLTFSPAMAELRVPQEVPPFIHSGYDEDRPSFGSFLFLWNHRLFQPKKKKACLQKSNPAQLVSIYFYFQGELAEISFCPGVSIRCGETHVPIGCTTLGCLHNLICCSTNMILICGL